MTEVSGAYETYDGTTILLKISEGNEKHRWVYMGGDKVCSFLTNTNTNEKTVDAYDLHLSRCWKKLVQKIKIYKFHSN